MNMGQSEITALTCDFNNDKTVKDKIAGRAGRSVTVLSETR